MDRNRHKRVCFDRAQAAGVAHAKLPIQKHMALHTSAVRGGLRRGWQRAAARQRGRGLGGRNLAGDGLCAAAEYGANAMLPSRLGRRQESHTPPKRAGSKRRLISSAHDVIAAPQVITVNQVVELMVRGQGPATDWAAVLAATLPMRKVVGGQECAKGGGGGDGDGDGDGDGGCSGDGDGDGGGGGGVGDGHGGGGSGGSGDGGEAAGEAAGGEGGEGNEHGSAEQQDAAGEAAGNDGAGGEGAEPDAKRQKL